MLLRDSRERYRGCLVCCGPNGAVVVLIVWCISCSECTGLETK